MARLMKHLQTMLSEDVSCKLFDLWKYESARGAGYTDAVNYANAHVILHDDTCFRFESRADDKLTIQQLFVDKSEVAGGEEKPSTIHCVSVCPLAQAISAASRRRMMVSVISPFGCFD